MNKRGQGRNGRRSSEGRRCLPCDSAYSPTLPLFREEMDRLGWDALDVLLITGDAYVDHPSFGAALIGRFLLASGWRVGIVAQPRWDTTADIARLGRPRLFAGITAGAQDSMLAHYTAFRKLRRDDAYTPGNRHGSRPNRACIVYTSLVKQAFPGLPVVLGGIEASLRRASHYDFWTDKLRRSILLDSKADVLVYGMGESASLEIARRLDALPDGKTAAVEVLRGIPGTAFAVSDLEPLQERGLLPDHGSLLRLPDHEEILQEPKALMTATLSLERQTHQGVQWAVQSSGGQHVVFAPPAAPLSAEALDALYALPFTRRPHPSYRESIPAADMIQFSVTAHRGCAAGCAFCSITLHQGRQIQSRSAASLEQEVRELTRHPDWKGHISDVGGPTANMWGARCASEPAHCRRVDCLYPAVCPHFKTANKQLAALLRRLASIEGVKGLRVASGVRNDLDGCQGDYLQTLIHEFVGGQLKIAPEHISDKVLELMRKPNLARFEAFLSFFEEESRRAGKEQYVIPYLVSAFPGCTDADMGELAQWLKQRGWRPRQVQCFIPTPGTVATAMFHAGVDVKGRPIYVARSDRDRMRQHKTLT